MGDISRPPGRSDKVPDLKKIFEHQGGGNGGNGEIMPFKPEKGIADDKRPGDRKQDPDGHGYPEGDIPPNQHDRGGVSPDAHILRLAQIHLAAITADGVPAHAVN